MLFIYYLIDLRIQQNDYQIKQHLLSHLTLITDTTIKFIIFILNYTCTRCSNCR